MSFRERESDFGVSDKDGRIEEGGAKTYENDISAEKKTMESSTIIKKTVWCMSVRDEHKKIIPLYSPILN